MNSVIFFQECGVLKTNLDYKWRRAADHTKHPQDGSLCPSGTTQRGAGLTTTATNDSNAGCGQDAGVVQ